jgi:hypothetical protein
MSEDHITDDPPQNKRETPRRASATFLSRHILLSDNHGFVGRVYDHHGHERPFTQDDVSFRTASLFEHRGSPMTGHDRYGRKLDVARSSREGLVGLQRDFNGSTRRLVRHLDKLYDLLGDEFEGRFEPLISTATHGLNAKRRARPKG